MFSGIIEDMGTVKRIDTAESIVTLQLFAAKIAGEVEARQSISVNGVCLSVVQVQEKLISFEIIPETLKRTNLSLLKPKDIVNLERAVRVDGRIDGHFVTGHIDAIGTISKKEKRPGEVMMEIESPAPILRYLVLKGSVAVDGVSLTVSAQHDHSFAVSLIPYTLKQTILGLKKEKDTVNIECDILAKYIDKLRSSASPYLASNLTASFLQEHGFI